MPASVDGPRQISFSSGNLEPPGVDYPHNGVKTSKYTALTFLPLNLFEQLHKFGNVYFLLISVLMYLGEKTKLFVGTIKAFSTLATLMMMMALTAFMALLDDRRRAAADRVTNNQKASCVTNGKVAPKLWEAVRVGDVLVVRQDEEFPADIVPFHCSGPEGTCYVSTANLDGETNLKLKAAATNVLGGPGAPERDIFGKLEELSGSIEAEKPRTSIHDFSGRLQLSGAQSADEPLGAKQLLLRGTVLRNTAWCCGVVVYTGAQTRMVMNSRKAPMKQSNLERVTNVVMLVILAAQAFLAVLSDVLFLINKDQYRSYWYLYTPSLILPDWLAYWLTFFVLFSNLMPISLYPTMEVCNAAQAYFIKQDEKMLWKETEMYAGVRSSNLCQELGQVAYVFSDKTGTLTQNIMELKRIAIAGTSYGSLQDGQRGFHDNDGALARARARGGPDGDMIRKFLEVLSVAHTVVLSKGKDGKEHYEAESPDESALVEAAAQLQFEFKGRVGTRMTVKVEGKGQEYDVLAVNQFDSTRKRMSVVVKIDGKYLLLCKGADNVMLERAADPKNQDAVVKNLTEFAKEGLRTLVVARRQLSTEYAEKWQKKYDAAQREIEDREGALTKVAVEIETEMEVVGVTAIEDKLQDNVPETIELIRKADIKLWVLTGDKLETARNIGFSSRVLTDDMCIRVLDRRDESPNQVGDDLHKVKDEIKQAVDAGTKAALLVTGPALEDIQKNSGLQSVFLKEVAKPCAIVIACRVSPLQKAYMVRMVREGITPQPVTLAIGDGANDVPMIQEAQVGVGIAGREGRQAMNNSDFSIGQFQYLQRLLFVHGRWNYRRVCKFTLFTFWRNAVQVLMIFYYTFISGYSGTSLFEDWIRLSFNFLCSFPIMATGIFDQDVDEKTAIANPELYMVGREGHDLNPTKMGITLVSAFGHSAILLGVTLCASLSMELQGVGDYYSFGTAVYTCLLVDMNYRVAFLNYTHNWYTIGSIVASFVLYVFYLIAYPCFKPIADMLTPNMYMVPWYLAKVPMFWLCIIVVPALAMTLDMTIHILFMHWSSELNNIAKLRADAAEMNKQNGEYDPLLDPPADPDSERGKAGRDWQWQYAQQKCTGVTFRPNRTCVSLAACIVGFVSLVSGLGVWKLSQSAGQVRIHYQGNPAVDVNPAGTDESSEVWSKQDDCREGSCSVTVRLPREMKPPILVYYTVGPFYQNFNDYLKSEVSKELMGQIVDESVRKSLCIEQTRLDKANKEIVPCGMKATSMFNDTFKIEGFDMDSKGIAWESDVARYDNPPDYKSRTGASWLWDRYPDIVSKEEGVKNEHFATWMRPCALWRIRNPYFWIDRGLAMGEELRIDIQSNFPLVEGGYKELVLTELNWLGGRHNGFAYLLMVSSLLCFVMALLACTCTPPE